MRQRHTDSHEHEFLVECDDDVVVEFDGEYVYASVQCAHAPIIDKAVDHSRDEVYTEHGPRCEATQDTTVAVSSPTNIVSGRVVEYDVAQTHWERIVLPNTDQIEQTVATEMVGEWATDETSVVVEDKQLNEEYRIDLTLDERTVET